MSKKSSSEDLNYCRVYSVDERNLYFLGRKDLSEIWFSPDAFPLQGSDSNSPMVPPLANSSRLRSVILKPRLSVYPFLSQTIHRGTFFIHKSRANDGNNFVSSKAISIKYVCQQKLSPRKAEKQHYYSR